MDCSLEWEYTYEKDNGTNTRVLNLFELNLAAINLVSEFDYNVGNRIPNLKYLWREVSDTIIFEQGITYKNDGLIEQITGKCANSFHYDGLKQLIFETLGNISSDYDELGNRLYRLDKSAIIPENNIFNDVNQLMKDKTANGVFTYDNNGNLETASFNTEPMTLFFDGMNNL